MIKMLDVVNFYRNNMVKEN